MEELLKESLRGGGPTPLGPVADKTIELFSKKEKYFYYFCIEGSECSLSTVPVVYCSDSGAFYSGWTVNRSNDQSLEEKTVP